MAVALNQNTIKGTGRFVLTSLNTYKNAVPLLLPNPTGFSFTPNIEFSEVRTQTPTGVSVPARLIETAANPEVTLEFPLNPISMALSLGNGWEDEAGATVELIEKTIATATTVVAAKTSGQMGFGVAEDATSVGSYADPADPTEFLALTQQTYSTFNPAVTDDSFAIGANGEVIVSANIVALSAAVVFRIPNVLNIRTIGEQAFDTFRVQGNLLLVDGSVINVVFPSLQVKPDSRTFDPTAGTVSLTMAALNDGSTCNYNPTVQYLGSSQILTC